MTFFEIYSGDPVGTRTQDPYIKSVLLYQLSYEINIIKELLLQLFTKTSRIHSIPVEEYSVNCATKRIDFLFQNWDAKIVKYCILQNFFLTKKKIG